MPAPLSFLAMSLLAVFVIAPLPVLPASGGYDLRQVWAGVAWPRKIGVVAVFLVSLAVVYRAHAASVIATSELRQGHSASVLHAYRRIRRKHLRFFWLLFLLGILLPPIGFMAVPVIAAFFAPVIPIAVLENLTVSEALRRLDQLTKGGYGRVVLLFLIYLFLSLVAIGALFSGMDLVHSLRLPRVIGSATYLMGLLLLLFVSQLWMVALTLNYYDQRTRKEGWQPNQV